VPRYVPEYRFQPDFATGFNITGLGISVTELSKRPNIAVFGVVDGSTQLDTVIAVIPGAVVEEEMLYPNGPGVDTVIPVVPPAGSTIPNVRPGDPASSHDPKASE
jgi:hypothetical protein